MSTTALNPEQQRAVEHSRGPLLVLSGAGSGKTRVITSRIAHLISRGILADNIMAVSFTNKASLEMKERMIPLIGKERAEKLWLSTFHRFGMRFLKEEYKSTGYGKRFVVFDQGDAMGLCRDIIKQEALADRNLDLMSVVGRISMWKNLGLGPEEVQIKQDDEYARVAHELYPFYQQALGMMHAYDFDDLVREPVRLLKTQEKLREKWSQRFTHMLVDEFQDTNHVQLELCKLLLNTQRNITAVGDDDQSIYGWRGALVSNILEFEKHFSGATIIKLEDNYRSTSSILALANATMKAGKDERYVKILRAALHKDKANKDEKVKRCVLGTPEQEARFVAGEIVKLGKELVRPKDIAILYRSNKQAKEFEEELRLQRIDYRLFGGQEFFDRKEIKDVMAFMRVWTHPTDELALRRIINYPPRGIGEQGLLRLERHAQAHGTTLLKAMEAVAKDPETPSALKNALSGFLDRFVQAELQSHNKEVSEVWLDLLKQLGVEQDLLSADNKEAGEKRWAGVTWLLKSLNRFVTEQTRDRPGDKSDAKELVHDFVQRMSLRVNDQEEVARDAVTLSTLHASKGLEFDVVFFVGVYEGQLPHARSLDPKANDAVVMDIEEERRLFYVGVTRARKRLYLCYPKRKPIKGKMIELSPSRFLWGLPEEHLEHVERDDSLPIEGDEAVAFGEALLAQLSR